MSRADRGRLGDLLLGSLDSLSLENNEGLRLDPSDRDDRPAPREAFVTMAGFRPIAVGSVVETVNAHMRKIKALTEMRVALSRSADLKKIELTRLEHQLSSMKAEHKSLRAELERRREEAGAALATSTSNEVSALVGRVPRPPAFSDIVSREKVTFDPLCESFQDELGDEYDHDYRYVIQASQREIISLQGNVNELDQKIAEASDRITKLARKCDKVKSELALFAQQSAVSERPSIAAQHHLPALQLHKVRVLTAEDRSAFHLPRRASSLSRPVAAPPSDLLPQAVFAGRAVMFRPVVDPGRVLKEETSLESLRSVSPPPEL